MTQRLIRRLAALGQYEEAIATLNASAAERPTALKTKQQNGQRSDVLSISDDAFILAQQLTHIELVRRDYIVYVPSRHVVFREVETEWHFCLN